MGAEDIACDIELTPEQFSSAVAAATEWITAHEHSLQDAFAPDLDEAKRFALTLVESAPENGGRLTDFLSLIFKEGVPRAFPATNPGFMAYVPTGGILTAAIADLIANSINRYVGIAEAAPALVQLETNVLRWFIKMVGYPATSRGVLTSGGSFANFMGALVARDQKLDDIRLGTAYGSDQTHYSVMKAVVMAGVPKKNIRLIPSDSNLKIKLSALREAIRADLAAGLKPFLLVGNAGTTNTGAIDDLPALRKIADEFGLWFHIDAAYGGFFLLTDRVRPRLRGIETGDSITLDPHKGLFLPYGTGAFLCRHVDALKKSFAMRGDYIPEFQNHPDLWDFSEISPEFSRDFRGLRVWLPLKWHGFSAFRRSLDEKIDLTLYGYDQISKIPGMELSGPPELTAFAFRYIPPSLKPGFRDAGAGFSNPPAHSRDALNDLNRKILKSINARGRAYLSGTLIRGEYFLRICVLCFRTHRRDMENALEDLRAALK